MDGCGDDLEAAELVAGQESSYFTKIICKKIGGTLSGVTKKISLDGIAQHFELVIEFFNRFPYLARGFFLLSGQMTIDSGSFAHFANVTERNILFKYT